MQTTLSLYAAYEVPAIHIEVAFNKKLAIMKENLHTEYILFIYSDVTLNKKPPIMNQNLCIFFFLLLL